MLLPTGWNRDRSGFEAFGDAAEISLRLNPPLGLGDPGGGVGVPAEGDGCKINKPRSKDVPITQPRHQLIGRTFGSRRGQALALQLLGSGRWRWGPQEVTVGEGTLGDRGPDQWL